MDNTKALSRDIAAAIQRRHKMAGGLTEREVSFALLKVLICVLGKYELDMCLALVAAAHADYRRPL